MTADHAADLALALFAAGVVTTFGVRSWVHRRRTGVSGFNGISGPVGSADWWGGVTFVAALVLAAAGLTLASLGGPARGSAGGSVGGSAGTWVGSLVPAPDGPAAVRWVGLALVVAGFGVTLAAQSGMGASWRIGVDHAETTDLVTTGLFGVVRNPIFTAMGTALGGLTLMVPTAVTVAAFACLLVAVQLQVRVVEEPYLRATQGAAYTAYAARVGRFVPGIGRVEVARDDGAC
jgi:protein-S-isoprenylcysteine O-methyltransferase Ste14